MTKKEKTESTLYNTDSGKIDICTQTVSYVAENGGFEAVPETDITEEEKKRKLT